MSLDLRETADGVVLPVRVQPGAKRSAVVGLHGGAVKVAVAAPPVEGKANDALLSYLRELFGLKRSQVELVRGDQSRDKAVLLRGLTAAIVQSALASHVTGPE